jgi:tetratricopeptide (TPR) repeat protein
MRLLALALCCLAAACSSVSEKQQQLANFQQTATLYYETGRYDQALRQIERGLDIEPDDYKLRAVRGMIWLKSSESATGTDHRQLDLATAELDEVYAMRSLRRHEPYLLLTYALAHQKQGRRWLGEAIRQRDQSQRGGGNAELAELAKTSDGNARRELGMAQEALDQLVERGESTRLAHKHLFQIHLELGDVPRSDHHAKAYLEQLAKDQETVQKEIERTPNLAYEREQTAMLRSMRDEELEARALLGQLAYDRKDYATARTMLDRVLELDPSRSGDYYNRARVLDALGERELARADFRKFLATTSLPATNEKAVVALRALDQ